MLRPYLLWLRGGVVASCLIPLIVLAYNIDRTNSKLPDSSTWDGIASKLITIALWVTLGCGLVWFVLTRFAKTIDVLSHEQNRFLSSLSSAWIAWAIFGSATLSLLLELAVIRWQGAVFEVFAFYKNFGLLACFLGLGLGYALSGRKQIPLLLTVPLLVWQMVLFAISRYGPAGWNSGVFMVAPVFEIHHMGLAQFQVNAKSVAYYGSVLYLLATVFVLTALAFVPIGQLCGSLMNRLPKLRAYGLNLLGSLLGVGLMFVLSMLWTPPLIWFGACFSMLIVFQAYNSRLLLMGALVSLVGLAALAWSATPLWEQIHSPYQLIERGPGDHGLTTVRAAGHYYQRIHDFDSDRDPAAKFTAAYYALPYRVHPHPERVVVVGAGTGNDVAMAVRMGAGHVDAVEIDPAILAVGTRFHPDQPYSNPRVRPIVNDARTFLRTSLDSYDMVVYGLLDSHALLSHGSSVRLDSFVYTVEAFREARERLKEGGVLSLAFCLLSAEQGRKIYLMLQEAFDGAPPIAIRAYYDGAVTFLHRKGRPVELPQDLLAGLLYSEVTAEMANPQVRADVSTDDWPFFYMPRRVYPISYLFVVALLLLLSLILILPFFHGKPHSNQAGFFLLGAGFMLVETKGITELGLTFGNTWQVIGIVIAGILVMAFIANFVVQGLRIRNVTVPYLLLLASLGTGLLVMKSGGFPPTAMGRLVAVVLLTCPLFFSGMVFSTMLQSGGDLSSAMAANLFGAMCGGLLEYNSMYFGFLSLYWLALAIYGAAFLLSFVKRRAPANNAVLSPS
jgi:Spermine/spermidine synthase domain